MNIGKKVSTAIEFLEAGIAGKNRLEPNVDAVASIIRFLTVGGRLERQRAVVELAKLHGRLMPTDAISMNDQRPRNVLRFVAERAIIALTI